MGGAVNFIKKNAGKIAGGVGGFAVGGPAGAAAGYQLGSSLDKKKGPGGGPTLSKQPFDIGKESAEYRQYFDMQRKEAEARQAAAQTPQLIEALRQQALGQGPSLAEAQLKSATNRNLAQQLSLAAAGRGRSPVAAQRQLVAETGTAQRSLAEQSAEARLKESQQAQQTLFGQTQQADQLGQTAATLGFNAAVKPKEALQTYETQRFNADVAKTNAIKKQQSDILGGVLGAAGQVGASFLAESGRVKMADGGRAPMPSKKVDKDEPKHQPQQMSLIDVLIDSFTPGNLDKPRPVNTNIKLRKADGGKVPGKAKVKGDSKKNDFVHALLSPGEIVVPRTHSQTPEKANAFVAALFAKEKGR